MQVLFVTSRGMKGGAERSLKTLTSWLTCDWYVWPVGKGWRPAFQHNGYTLLRFLASFWWLEWHRIRKRQREFDIIHLNHEGLIWYAIGAKIPVVCHVRTMWPVSRWGRLFAVLVGLIADQIICITENEQKRLQGLRAAETVIYNIAFGKGEAGHDETK